MHQRPVHRHQLSHQIDRPWNIVLVTSNFHMNLKMKAKSNNKYYAQWFPHIFPSQRMGRTLKNAGINPASFTTVSQEEGGLKAGVVSNSITPAILFGNVCFVKFQYITFSNNFSTLSRSRFLPGLCSYDDRYCRQNWKILKRSVFSKSFFAAKCIW